MDISSESLIKIQLTSYHSLVTLVPGVVVYAVAASNILMPHTYISHLNSI